MPHLDRTLPHRIPSAPQPTNSNPPISAKTHPSLDGLCGSLLASLINRPDAQGEEVLPPSVGGRFWCRRSVEFPRACLRMLIRASTQPHRDDSPRHSRLLLFLSSTTHGTSSSAQTVPGWLRLCTFSTPVQSERPVKKAAPVGEGVQKSTGPAGPRTKWTP